VQQWEPAMLQKMDQLSDRRVLYLGDLNVAPQPLDLHNAEACHGQPGFTKEERQAFFELQRRGFLDTFRVHHPEERKYSWWPYFGKERALNHGWRIDHILSRRALPLRVDIATDIQASDHSPMWADI
jgi:exodeoxyribonuclease-3